MTAPFRRYSPRDARGRPFRFCKLKSLPRSPWRVRLAMNHANPWVMHMWLINAGYMLLILLAFAFFRWRAVRGLAPLAPTPRSGGFLLHPTLLWVVVACIAGWLLHRALRPWFYRRAIRACTGFGHRPACAYDLQGIPAGDDGRTVCPECGAAWEVGRRP